MVSQNKLFCGNKCFLFYNKCLLFYDKCLLIFNKCLLLFDKSLFLSCKVFPQTFGSIPKVCCGL